MKKRHSQALITVEDLAAVREMTDGGDKQEDYFDPVQWEMCAEEEDAEDLTFIADINEEDSSGIKHITREDMKSIWDRKNSKTIPPIRSCDICRLSYNR